MQREFAGRPLEASRRADTATMAHYCAKTADLRITTATAAKSSQRIHICLRGQASMPGARQNKVRAKSA